MGLNICVGVIFLKCFRWIIRGLRGFLINCEVVLIGFYLGLVKKRKFYVLNSLFNLQEFYKNLFFFYDGSSYFDFRLTEGNVSRRILVFLYRST